MIQQGKGHIWLNQILLNKFQKNKLCIQNFQWWHRKFQVGNSNNWLNQHWWQKFLLHKKCKRQIQH